MRWRAAPYNFAPPNTSFLVPTTSYLVVEDYEGSILHSRNQVGVAEETNASRCNPEISSLESALETENIHFQHALTCTGISKQHSEVLNVVDAVKSPQLHKNVAQSL
jgi:hypothetical protein